MNLKKKSLILPRFKLGILGGTFDHLHAGQKAFLEKAFLVCQEILIGLTSEKFTQDKFISKTVLPFKKRKQELEKFLKTKKFFKRARIVEIDSPFPPAIFNPKIECLFMTEKTEKNAQILNLKRIKKNLPSLRMIKFPIVTNDQGECISSEKIRLGQMDRAGRVFVETKFFKKIHFLPQGVRPLLKKPLGRLVLGSEKNLAEAALKVKKILKITPPVFLVTVGDVVTLSLIKEGVMPDLSIVDFKVGRRKVYQDITQLGFSSNVRVRKAINEPGTLNPEIFLKIEKFIKDRFWIKSGMTKRSREARTIRKWVHPSLVIKVLGEEDLASLPAVLLFPLKTLVCYGQPETGIVVIEVTERRKQEFKQILHQFQLKDRQ